MSAPYIPQIALYRQWLKDTRGLSFGSYDEMWRWSVTDLDAYWQSIWDYFAIQSPTPHSAVLGRRDMPNAVWFPGAQVNYARQIFRHVEAASKAGLPAVVSRNEKGVHRELSWPELRRQSASLALHLKAQGVKPGDRVAAYLPNIIETMIAFFATASIGGVWSLCAPDMGTAAVLDRFKQIEPKVLIACDGVSYAGKDYDRTQVVQELRAALPSVQHPDRARQSRHDRRALQAASASPMRSRAMMRRRRRSSRNGCRSIIRCGSSIPAAPPACRSRSCTAMAASCLMSLALNVIHNDIGCSYAPNSYRRALSLVLVDRLGDVELPDQRAAQRHHLLHL